MSKKWHKNRRKGGNCEMEILGNLEKIGETLSEKGKEAVDKAKVLAEIASLKGQVNTCEEVIRQNYLEIGRTYYEACHESPDALFEKQCRAIDNARYGISELQAKIEELKEKKN